MSLLDISIACASACGDRASNEDALRVGDHGWGRYAVLADGAGGHARGAEASLRVVEKVEFGLRTAAPGSFGAATLSAVLQAAHLELQEAQHAARGRARMHATVVVLWIEAASGRALWSHVGDSRLYRARYGTTRLLTADDSVVQRLLESGALSPAQARDHPLKNRLLAALGMREGVQPHTAAAPEFLEDGDAFLLCSDGWWSALDEAEVDATLRDAQSPEAWLAAMAELIESRGEPGQDNYSAVAVWATDPNESTHPMPDSAIGAWAT